MRKATIASIGALLATGCTSGVSDLKVTNKSLAPLEVAVGQRSITIAPGQTARLAGIAMRAKSDQIVFEQDGHGFVFQHPEDDRRAAASPQLIWFGDGRLALKV